MGKEGEVSGDSVNSLSNLWMERGKETVLLNSRPSRPSEDCGKGRDGEGKIHSAMLCYRKERKRGKNFSCAAFTKGGFWLRELSLSFRVDQVLRLR